MALATAPRPLKFMVRDVNTTRLHLIQHRKITNYMNKLSLSNTFFLIISCILVRNSVVDNVVKLRAGQLKKLGSIHCRGETSLFSEVFRRLWVLPSPPIRGVSTAVRRAQRLAVQQRTALTRILLFLEIKITLFWEAFTRNNVSPFTLVCTSHFEASKLEIKLYAVDHNYIYMDN